MSELRTRIESHLRTTIRYAIATGRIAHYYNNKLLGADKNDRKVNIFMHLDTGKQSTVSGLGKIYEEYKKTGKIANYTGYGLAPVEFGDEDFDSAPYRKIDFDETYAHMPYDARRSELILSFDELCCCNSFFITYTNR